MPRLGAARLGLALVVVLVVLVTGAIAIAKVSADTTRSCIPGPGARLQGCNFDLQNADLGGANLFGTDLYGTNLKGANLQGANLQGVNLKGANLFGVEWSNAICPDGTNSDNDGNTCEGHFP
jgi:uncharacterized protein YjbI with pentapeptide repeats